MIDTCLLGIKSIVARLGLGGRSLRVGGGWVEINYTPQGRYRWILLYREFGLL